jgi:hypothetical protein
LLAIPELRAHAKDLVNKRYSVLAVTDVNRFTPRPNSHVAGGELMALGLRGTESTAFQRASVSGVHSKPIRALPGRCWRRKVTPGRGYPSNRSSEHRRLAEVDRLEAEIERLQRDTQAGSPRRGATRPSGIDHLRIGV